MNCVCGCPAHPYDECPCGCTLFELDNGTFVSPTETGRADLISITDYNGRYSGIVENHYEY